MKNLNLSIANPCSENWSTFKSTQAGGFCQSCSTEVIDFTSMRDDEILHLFTNRPSETCGRFRSGQLKIYSHASQRSSIEPGVKLLRAGLLVLLFGLLSKPVAAHIINEKPKIETLIIKQHAISVTVSEHLIKGVIKSEEGDPMPGVNIQSKTGIDGTVSNANGEFEFPRKLAAGEVIIFSFIGFQK